MLVKPFRMLLELVVLLACLTWALLCLVKSWTLDLVRLVACLALGLARLVVGLTLGLARSVLCLTLGLIRLVVCLPCALRRAVVRLAQTLLRLVTLWVWVLLCRGVPCALLICLGFAATHALWLMFRGQPMSMSVVLKTLNLTLRARACPF